MNFFDIGILKYLNQFANRSQWFDIVVSDLFDLDLLKGAAVMFLYWWALFSHKDKDERRYALLTLLPMSILAIFFARVLALALPFRERPLRTAALHFSLPAGVSAKVLEGWSSFPSDHAVFFFALATGILFASRALGWFAMFYVTVCICLPRVYTGLHWPTDIIGGALIGAAFANLSRIPRLRDSVGGFAARVHERAPGLFFAVLFILSYQVATLFGDSRHILWVLWHGPHH